MGSSEAPNGDAATAAIAAVILKALSPMTQALTDEDAHSLAAYLKTLPPVRNAVPRMAGPNEKPPAPYLTVTGG